MLETQASNKTNGLARRITAAFCGGRLKISRPNAPIAGWDGMPEVYVTNRIRKADASDADVRLFLTFTAAMDRARDADALWVAAGNLFLTEKWAFNPGDVIASSEAKLANVLKKYKVSQRHGTDCAAWRTIAATLADRSKAPKTYEAIYGGMGDAIGLQDEVEGVDSKGRNLFPLLRGPKIRAMWVRMLACPGRAEISKIRKIPVAVDVQVRKVTQYLGVTDTVKEDLGAIRKVIQDAWKNDVERFGAEGPPAIANTSAALDPALWFFAKWGCTNCEKAKQKVPVADVCSICLFDQLCPGGRISKQRGSCS